MQYAEAPGNVLLEKGEANLPKQSVVNISQIYTVDKRDLEDFIGSLTNNRITQIIDGIRLITEADRRASHQVK